MIPINKWFESKSLAEQWTSNRGDDHVENVSYLQVHKPTRRQSTETRTNKLTEKSSSEVLPKRQKPTGMQSTETHTVKPIEQSDKNSTGKVDRVNKDSNNAAS